MALIIDYACPFDFQVKWKTTRKKKMRTIKTWRGSWNGSKNCAKVTVVPVIIGALGTVPTERFIIKWLAEISVTCRLESLQRACLDILCHGRWLDTPAIHLEAVFNEDNNNNKYDLSNFFYPRVLTEVFYLVVYV